jgi:hypothetical protein
MRSGKQGERVRRDKIYLEIGVAGCLEIYSCAIKGGGGIDRSRPIWLLQTPDGTNIFHDTDMALHNTKQVVSPNAISLRKEQKFAVNSQKQRRRQAEFRPTSTGQKGTFPLFVPPRHSRTRSLSPLASKFICPGVGRPQVHDATTTAGMRMTESRPPASAVYPKPLCFCVGGTTASRYARAATFSNGGIWPLVP